MSNQEQNKRKLPSWFSTYFKNIEDNDNVNPKEPSSHLDLEESGVKKLYNL